MPVSQTFRDWIRDQLSPSVPNLRDRSMFGGVGIYAGELFFSTLYRLEALEAAQGADLFEPFINERLGFLPGPLKGRLVRDLSFDPANKPALGAWMSRYLSRSLHRPVNSVVIAREAYRYENARPVRISTEVLLRH